MPQNKVKPKIDAVNKKYAGQLQKIKDVQDQLDMKINRLGFSEERKEVIKQLKKGEVPQGDDYTSTSVRNTLDKVLTAALEARKLNKVIPSDANQRIQEMGVIPQPIKNTDELLEEVKLYEQQVEQDFAFAKSEVDGIDPNTKITDDAGNIVTLRKYLDSTDEVAEETAVRTCAKPGGEV